MHRSVPAVLLATLVLLSGCSSLLGGDPLGRQPGTDTPTVTATPTPTPTTTRIPTRSFSADTDLGAIVLRRSDLDAGYRLTGETDETRRSLSGERLAEFETNAIVRYHSRSFSPKDTGVDRPILILSEATVYASSSAAEDRLTATLRGFADGGAEVTEVAVATDVGASTVRFENERGLKNVAYYKREGNLVVSVIVTGRDTFHPETAERLFLKVLVDIPSE